MIHESRKTTKYILVSLILTSVTFSFHGAMTIHWFFWFLSFGLLSFLLLIRFKKLEVTPHEIKFEDRSILPFLNQKTKIPISSISQVEERPNSVDKPFLLFDLLGLRNRGLNSSNFIDHSKSRPHTLTIRTDGDINFSITRFGNHIGFKKIIDEIKTVANKK